MEEKNGKKVVQHPHHNSHVRIKLGLYHCRATEKRITKVYRRTTFAKIPPFWMFVSQLHLVPPELEYPWLSHFNLLSV